MKRAGRVTTERQFLKEFRPRFKAQRQASRERVARVKALRRAELRGARFFRKFTLAQFQKVKEKPVSELTSADIAVLSVVAEASPFTSREKKIAVEKLEGFQRKLPSQFKTPQRKVSSQEIRQKRIIRRGTPEGLAILERKAMIRGKFAGKSRLTARQVKVLQQRKKLKEKERQIKFITQTGPTRSRSQKEEKIPFTLRIPISEKKRKFLKNIKVKKELLGRTSPLQIERERKKFEITLAKGVRLGIKPKKKPIKGEQEKKVKEIFSLTFGPREKPKGILERTKAEIQLIKFGKGGIRRRQELAEEALVSVPFVGPAGFAVPIISTGLKIITGPVRMRLTEKRAVKTQKQISKIRNPQLRREKQLKKNIQSFNKEVSSFNKKTKELQTKRFTPQQADVINRQLEKEFKTLSSRESGLKIRQKSVLESGQETLVKVRKTQLKGGGIISAPGLSVSEKALFGAVQPETLKTISFFGVAGLKQIIGKGIIKTQLAKTPTRVGISVRESISPTVTKITTPITKGKFFKGGIVSIETKIPGGKTITKSELVGTIRGGDTLLGRQLTKSEIGRLSKTLGTFVVKEKPGIKVGTISVSQKFKGGPVDITKDIFIGKGKLGKQSIIGEIPAGRGEFGRELVKGVFVKGGKKTKFKEFKEIIQVIERTGEPPIKEFSLKPVKFPSGTEKDIDKLFVSSAKKFPPPKVRFNVKQFFKDISPGFLKKTKQPKRLTGGDINAIFGKPSSQLFISPKGQTGFSQKQINKALSSITKPSIAKEVTPRTVGTPPGLGTIIFEATKPRLTGKEITFLGVQFPQILGLGRKQNIIEGQKQESFTFIKPTQPQRLFISPKVRTQPKQVISQNVGISEAIIQTQPVQQINITQLLGDTRTVTGRFVGPSTTFPKFPFFLPLGGGGGGESTRRKKKKRKGFPISIGPSLAGQFLGIKRTSIGRPGRPLFVTGFEARGEDVLRRFTG